MQLPHIIICHPSQLFIFGIVQLKQFFLTLQLPYKVVYFHEPSWHLLQYYQQYFHQQLQNQRRQNWLCYLMLRQTQLTQYLWYDYVLFHPLHILYNQKLQKEYYHYHVNQHYQFHMLNQNHHFYLAFLDLLMKVYGYEKEFDLKSKLHFLQVYQVSHRYECAPTLCLCEFNP